MTNKVQQGRKVMQSRLFLLLSLVFALVLSAPSIDNAQFPESSVDFSPVSTESRETILLSYIKVRCEQERIPVKLVHNIINHESRWRRRAVGEVVGTALIASSDPSYGLMQIMLPTAWEIMEDTTITKEQLMTDDLLNVECGIRYLSQLKRSFRGNLRYAVIAYNRGRGGVYDAFRRNVDPDEHGYAKRVMPVVIAKR